jgi:medium-chain acyl-[acyl-carrier-protein] hydrolase
VTQAVREPVAVRRDDCVVPLVREAGGPRLVCFPAGGGGANAFYDWRTLVPEPLELWGVRLAGRESRWQEPPAGSVAGAVAELRAALEPEPGHGPQVFVGHCFGALLAFETVRALAAGGAELPSRLVLLAQTAPHVEIHREPMHDLPLEELLECVRRMRATDERVLGTPNLFRLLEPALRADFRAAYEYRYADGPRLALPLTIYVPEASAEQRLDDYLRWEELAVDEIEIHVVAGDSFFEPDAWERVGRAVAAEAAEAAAGRAP